MYPSYKNRLENLSRNFQKHILHQSICFPLLFSVDSPIFPLTPASYHDKFSSVNQFSGFFAFAFGKPYLIPSSSFLFKRHISEVKKSQITIRVANDGIINKIITFPLSEDNKRYFIRIAILVIWDLYDIL